MSCRLTHPPRPNTIPDPKPYFALSPLISTYFLYARVYVGWCLSTGQQKPPLLLQEFRHVTFAKNEPSLSFSPPPTPSLNAIPASNSPRLRLSPFDLHTHTTLTPSSTLFTHNPRCLTPVEGILITQSFPSRLNARILIFLFISFLCVLFSPTLLSSSLFHSLYPSLFLSPSHSSSIFVCILFLSTHPPPSHRSPSPPPKS